MRGGVRERGRGGRGRKKGGGVEREWVHEGERRIEEKGNGVNVEEEMEMEWRKLIPTIDEKIVCQCACACACTCTCTCTCTHMYRLSSGSAYVSVFQSLSIPVLCVLNFCVYLELNLFYANAICI